MSGLLQFYVPQAGVNFLKSWNETEGVPNNPLDGIGMPYSVGWSGSYALGDSIRYDVFPYRQVAQRIYAGAVVVYSVTVEAENAAMQWPAWSSYPGWVSGFIVLRYVNGAYAGYLDQSSMTMFAGWTDDAWGWSGPEAMPCSFANPPVTVKVLWNQPDWTEGPLELDTVLSPFGGLAFSSMNGDKLVRVLSDDLRRSLDGTFAFWFCPAAESSGALGAIRGVYSGSYFGNYSCSPPALDFGNSGEIGVLNHQDGDWYLAVVRHDTLTASHTLDLLRERDNARFSASVADLTYIAGLDSESDYLNEGLWALAAVGDSGHWGIHGYAYFDRIGIWNRALTEEEVLDLFNSGLAWQPE